MIKKSNTDIIHFSISILVNSGFLEYSLHASHFDDYSATSHVDFRDNCKLFCPVDQNHSTYYRLI